MRGRSTPSKARMKRLPYLSGLFFIFAVSAAAGCSTKVITTPGDPAQSNDPTEKDKEASSSGGSNTPDPSSASSSSSSGEPQKPKGLGTWEEKGLAIVDGDTQTKKTCGDVCASKGGSCVLGLDPVQGGSSPVAGIAQYVFVQPGQPAGFIPYDLPACSSPVAATQASTNDTGSLYKYECSCDGVAVPPRAILKASDGLHTCKDVCTSWGKTCTNKRTWEDGTEGGALAFYGENVKAFNCGTVPDAKLSSTALDGYWCACE